MWSSVRFQPNILGLSEAEFKKVNDEVARINKMSFDERNKYIQEVMESLCRNPSEPGRIADPKVAPKPAVYSPRQEAPKPAQKSPQQEINFPPRRETSKDEVEEDVIETKPESVNHPTHYNVGKFEVIDVIEDWRLGFNLGNVVKYVARAEHKGNTVEDLEKALWYIQREIDSRKTRNSSKP